MNVGSGSVISDSAQINPGVIVDSDISATAAIAHSKLAGTAASGANADITSITGLTTALTVEQGGTERTSLDANELLVGGGVGAPVSIATGDAGQLLTSGGVGVDPSFSVAVGTTGQVLTSAGAGANPTFETLAAFTAVKVGQTTRSANTASGTQNIAHGGGKIPKFVRIIATEIETSGADYMVTSETIYDGTTQASVSVYRINSGYIKATSFIISVKLDDTGYSTGVVTFDATNIIITWTKTGTAGGTYDLLWTAFF